MATPIENYALISDCHSCALVGKDGSIDWLSFPCFDSAACCAALLGSEDHGHWQISPQGQYQITRRYVEETMVLETTFKSENGACKLTDCMLIQDKVPTLVRCIEGIEGSVDILLELVIRYDYGSVVPWVRRNEAGDGIHAVGGPEAIVLYSEVPLKGRNMRTCAGFSIKAGEKKSFELMWYPSHLPIPARLKDPAESVAKTVSWWREWMSRCQYHGFDEQAVKRSLLTLKALTYEPTGAILAAPTTSLPETIGGTRNWDYRFSWIRDSSFMLYALIKSGYKEEALRWKEWLLRAVAGTPSQVNIMYGIRGERRLTEFDLDWLPGYENSRPVRIGNDAYKQFQLDVFGELMATSLLGRQNGIAISEDNWRVEKEMLEYVSEHWRDPDEGIWEIRGPKRHFTHSKVMAWVALNSAIETVKQFGLQGDIQQWSKIRDEIHRDVCQYGFNSDINAFVQSYGSADLDASLLMLTHVGFLPASDPRMAGTIEAIRKNLTIDGHVLRYLNDPHLEGLHGEEGSFIACSFWLVDNLRMLGKEQEAKDLYQRLSKIRNDVGLFAEEYSTKSNRMLGNFPQALSHIAHVVSAMGFESHSSE